MTTLAIALAIGFILAIALLFEATKRLNELGSKLTSANALAEKRHKQVKELRFSIEEKKTELNKLIDKVDRMQEVLDD
jgi:uncharacterized coiled-coil protein SlyX